mmetsp:Transcript_18868/g.25956  ORF Transcript_18868/g.25956 Transcript_18868/m.25956 type:complete len:316 (-) Transcript_18868:649-1596(-)
MNSDPTLKDPLLVVNMSNADSIMVTSLQNETDIIPSLPPTNSTHDNIHNSGEEQSILELRLSILGYILVPFMFLLCLRPGSGKASTRRFRDEREALEAYAANRRRDSQQQNENEKNKKADPEERKKIVERSLITSTISSYDEESGGIILSSDITPPQTEKEEEEIINGENKQEPNFDIDDDDEAACSCMICLEPYTVGEKVSYFRESSLDCRHVFHHECITEWLMRQDECPGCRTCFLIKSIQEDEKAEDQNEVEQADEQVEEEIDLEWGKRLAEDRVANNQVLRIVDGLISKSTTKMQGATYSRVSAPENDEEC